MQARGLGAGFVDSYHWALGCAGSRTLLHLFVERLPLGRILFSSKSQDENHHIFFFLVLVTICLENEAREPVPIPWKCLSRE